MCLLLICSVCTVSSETRVAHFYSHTFLFFFYLSSSFLLPKKCCLAASTLFPAFFVSVPCIFRKISMENRKKVKKTHDLWPFRHHFKERGLPSAVVLFSLFLSKPWMLLTLFILIINTFKVTCCCLSWASVFLVVGAFAAGSLDVWAAFQNKHRLP